MAAAVKTGRGALAALVSKLDLAEECARTSVEHFSILGIDACFAHREMKALWKEKPELAKKMQLLAEKAKQRSSGSSSDPPWEQLTKSQRKNLRKTEKMKAEKQKEEGTNRHAEL